MEKEDPWFRQGQDLEFVWVLDRTGTNFLTPSRRWSRLLSDNRPSCAWRIANFSTNSQYFGSI